MCRQGCSPLDAHLEQVLLNLVNDLHGINLVILDLDPLVYLDPLQGFGGMYDLGENKTEGGKSLGMSTIAMNYAIPKLL